MAFLFDALLLRRLFRSASATTANLESKTNSGPAPHDFRASQNSQNSKQRSKILIHAINFAPEMIGCGKYTTELAQYLAQRGHKIEVVTAPPHYPGWFVRPPYRAFAYRSEMIGRIKVTRCPMLMKENGGGFWRLLAPLSFAISAAPAAFWRVLRFRPDVVLCVEPTLFSAPAALLAAKIIGARTVLHVQDLEIDAAFDVGHIKGGWVRTAANFLERKLLSGFDQILTISEKMRVALVAKGLPKSKTSVLRNWVDIEAIKPWPRSRDNGFRGQLGLDPKQFVVLYAGHVGVKQALDVVLGAARRLVMDESIHFVIAGEGPMKEPLRAANGDLGNVSFLPMQPVERLDELLNLADLHVLPQHKGAADLVFPSKLGGMLASGRPIVATAEAGSELSDVLTGVALLTPAGDVAALADAVAFAKHADLGKYVEKGLRLAQSLSSPRILSKFEYMLTEHSTGLPQMAQQGRSSAKAA
jgi:colanic acid biosynthesis glycosyl transferase WcaI